MTRFARASGTFIAALALALVATGCNAGRGDDARSRTPTIPSATSAPVPATTAAVTGDPCAPAAAAVGGPAGESVFAEADFATALAWAPDG